MNKIKFCKPGSEVVLVKVSQSTRATNPVPHKEGKGYHPPQSITVPMANKMMLAKGFIRAGSKA